MANQILVARPSMPSLEEYVKEIEPIWENHWLTNMGVKHKTFETHLKSYLGVENITLYTNGHAALECAFEALNLKGKVITTPFSFASTTHAIVRKGLTPVFADIKETDYTIDSEKIEPLIDDETCAIVPVHIYGNVCDYKAIERIAKKHNLKVIYDAAHAFGVTVNGQSVASMGDISMFSFHATKVFNTIEGGALVFKDPKLTGLLNQWKNFGITGPENVQYVGCNAKMNEFCAAMGICNLRHLDEEIVKRKRVANRYVELLSSVPGIQLCMPSENVKSNYAYFPVVFTEEFPATRNEVFSALAEIGISSRKYFYPLINDYDCYRFMFDSKTTPVAKYISDRVLTLPIYSDLSLEVIDLICNTILSLKQ